MLPFAPGIVGYCTEKDDVLYLELRSLRKPQTVTFSTQDQTVINTIKGEFSSILEDYLGDHLPGFSDAFMEMQSYPVPFEGEEWEFNIINDVEMKFCWIPAGKAILGSPKNEKGRHPNETEHEFETNSFWMGKYPVTQIQWKAAMGNNPSNFLGDNLPVENINWDDCQCFIKKCNVSGLKLQLPHEDQWEYACRGGKGNKQAFYWGNELNGDKANCNGNLPHGTDKKGVYLEKTTEVGSYEKVAPHPWNLCDMSGNVMEWCEKFHTAGNLGWIVRGGSWNFKSGFCRSSFRSWIDPMGCNNYLGFRLIIC